VVDYQFQDQYLGRFRFDELTDWSRHPNDTIKYFSGTATYTTSFNYPTKITNNQRLFLDLGKVNIAAEIMLNGENIGVTWMKPHRIEITETLQTGKNELTIKLTNQWSNRLIGDERFPKQDDGYRLGRHGSNPDLFMPEWYVKNEPLPDGPRTTFSTASFYKDGDNLYPSGLLGPVRIDGVLEVDLSIKK